ncbi:hypothetical protein HYT56_04690 [Candidatus Woesearchaeota archaeon]|nr:hypothetical protein [Candidatus Woesearchaeota archaeon]
MDFKTHLKEGKIKKINKDNLRANNLKKSSKQAIETSKIISLNENTCKTIFRELYEGLREYCEALGYIKGYKFLDHISITYFLDEILNEKEISKKFDRYRKIRNGINYYGEDVDIETVKEALKEIPKIIKELEK